MVGIEVVLFVVVLVLGVIGLVRGPARELGVTMALVVLLAFLGQFNNLVPVDEMPAKINNITGRLGFGSDDLMRQQTAVWVIYSAVIVMTAFLAYHGQDTLAFKFAGARGLIGVFLGGLVGAFNGYLIGGTIWYYLHKLAYPIQRFSWFRAEFTDLTRNTIQYLPQSLASGMVLSAAALALLWWRIAR